MRFILYLSNCMIPLVIFYIVGYGILQRTNVYEDFIKGATKGFKTVVEIMPTLVALMVGVGILRASGFLDFVAELLKPLAELLGFPAELVPLTLVRLFSSSAATGMTIDIFKEFGADSYVGKITSILMSSTETVFYTMSVYFLTVKVSKTRYTLAGALIATLAGIVASVWLSGWM